MVERNRPTPPAYETRRVGGWSGTAAVTPPEQKEKKPRSAGSVLAVQSIACVVALLLALLMRAAGGEAYQQLRQSFRASLMRNDLLATLAALWDGNPADGVSAALEAENEQAPPADAAGDSAAEQDKTTGTAPAPTGTAGEGRLPPEGTLAVKLRVDRAARPPVEDGAISSVYGYRENPTGTGEQFHKGIDIAAPAGTPIAAMFFGRVAAVGESGSLGKYVVLDHGAGVQVLYAHCSVVEATEGTVVRAGETVARVGATGDATGNHVHIQVSVAGTVYNPAGIVPVERYA